MNLSTVDVKLHAEGDAGVHRCLQMWQKLPTAIVKELLFIFLYICLMNEETCQIDKSSSFSSLQDGFYSYA